MAKKESKTAKLGFKELIAIGVGGMIGGGIFSVLGLAVSIAGHAAPFSFALGTLIAVIAGYSFIRLALTFRNDGASFTYLEHAFPKLPNLAGIAGWMVIVGYVGTLALYAFTFGAYGADLLGFAGSYAVRIILSIGVLLFFMGVNIIGVKASGSTEDVIVYSKMVLLGFFALMGIFHVRKANLQPLFDQGVGSVFQAAALIFVAYEGFELITNAVCETRNPHRNIPRGIFGSIGITSVIYIILAVVAVGTLSLKDIIAAREYALAAAAGPSLGQVGHVLVGLAALLATSSAINGTIFGASRMTAEMSRMKEMPAAFSLRNRSNVPWSAVVVLTFLAIVFSISNSLESIAAFSSMIFLLLATAVSLANLRIHRQTHSRVLVVLTGIVLMLATLITLLVYLWKSKPRILVLSLGIFLVVVVIELVFSKRRIWLKGKSPTPPAEAQGTGCSRDDPE
jgi:amino acid transporter